MSRVTAMGRRNLLVSAAIGAFSMIAREYDSPRVGAKWRLDDVTAR